MSRERLDYLTRVLISGVCAVFLLYVAWQVFDRFRTVFVLIGCAALLAYAISPLVNRLNRFMWRPAAVLLAYTGIAGVLLGGGYLLFGPVVRQLSDAVAHLPAQNALIQQRLVDADRVLAEHGLVVHLASSQSKIVSTLQAQGGDLLSRTLAIASSIANLLLDALVCLFMSIYMVLDGHRIHDQAMRLVPQKYRE
ncbi:MAG: hypothetical protein JWO42_3118, partial [Chloroflexi bacterium]|nr:hypothetical protein [Chloroflexota bacterium]